jgi:hypothetical protein
MTWSFESGQSMIASESECRNVGNGVNMYNGCKYKHDAPLVSPICENIADC